ncbi:MAG: phosphonate C-P lyase system protein PhnH [Gammaproteobacteria bacterium]|nr:phosphonate C-P lyase system protein PhnH [Gammaproteobacteria bacterium]MCW8988510.1 phosphonate C-P lyase system protein PhnH [Gammaproteobacteria bacterium]
MLNLDPVWQPDSQQGYFRLLLEAMSYPGKCLEVDDLPKDESMTMTVLATLLDNEVSLSDPHTLLIERDWSMLQVKPESDEQADYILCKASELSDFEPKLGTLSSPEKSATIVLLVDKLGEGEHKLKLTGPGIKNSEVLYIKGLHSDWLLKRENWNSSFPLGVDYIFVDDKSFAALPRTTKVEIM